MKIFIKFLVKARFLVEKLLNDAKKQKIKHKHYSNLAIFKIQKNY